MPETGDGGRHCPDCGNVEYCGVRADGLFSNGIAYKCSDCGRAWKVEKGGLHA